MGRTNLPAFNHKANLESGALFDQALVDRGHDQHHGQGCVRARQMAVSQNDNTPFGSRKCHHLVSNTINGGNQRGLVGPCIALNWFIKYIKSCPWRISLHHDFEHICHAQHR